MIINFTKKSEYRNVCVLCDKDVSSRYYQLELQFIEGGRDISAYRHICTNCYNGLSQFFRGDLE